MTLASHRPPILVELKPGTEPANVCQYPMSLEAKQGITPHIHFLLNQEVLKPILQSELLAELDDQDLFQTLETLQLTHK